MVDWISQHICFLGTWCCCVVDAVVFVAVGVIAVVVGKDTLICLKLNKVLLFGKVEEIAVAVAIVVVWKATLISFKLNKVLMFCKVEVLCVYVWEFRLMT